MELGGEMISSFLSREAGSVQSTQVSEDPRVAEPTSIFFAHRLDYEMILSLLPDRASVVDLGCGNGELLAMLRDRGHSPLLGVERNQTEVAECIGRGLDVIHADLDQGIAALPDLSFDVALLSQTLQSIVGVANVLDEIVRIGHLGIVSFPNFAHRPLREMFMKEGRLPKEEGRYAYEWHNTPNRRFPSILDFKELCQQRGIRIEQAIYVNSQTGTKISDDPNLHADLAIMTLTRR